MVTAAAVIIGDEILSGKVRDTNGHRLIDLLRSVGVELCRITTIGDDPAQIAEEVGRCAARYDYVFTSGGIGPTHDDRTMEGIAQAFSVGLVRHPRLESLVRHYLGERVAEAAFKMAEVPEGTRLLGDGPVPALTFRNIFILPGIPQFFVAQLELVRSLFSGKSPTLHRLYLRAEECDIAELLGRVQRDLPSVKIGSYPRFGDPSYSVLVTVEGSDAGQVQTALTELITRLPEDRLLRVESGEE